MEIFDNPLYNCFVMPILCKDLMLAGLTKETVYQWKVRNKLAVLHTVAFDIDGYYKDAIEIVDRECLILPAFTIKDVESALSDYFLSCSANGEYEITLASYYQLQAFKAPRMPDAFAMLLLEAIRKGICRPDKINQNILMV